MSTVVLFQGVTMDFRKIYSESKFVREQVKKLQKISSVDIEKTCKKTQSCDPARTMREQPAIFAVSMAKFMENPISDICLTVGHSFGEYAALCASGVLTIEDAMRVSEERGNLTALSNLRQRGDMAVIIGQITKSNLSQIIRPICQEQDIDLAGVNSPEQATISGPIHSLSNACDLLQEYNFTTVPINAGCAFHSWCMMDIKDEFRKFLDTVHFSTPEIPILMNATASCEENPERIKDSLVMQLTQPVDFPIVVNAMKEYDVEKLHEVGAKKTLIGFIKKIRGKK